MTPPPANTHLERLDLQQVITSFTQLPPLPRVVSELMVCLQQDDVDTEQVVQLLNQDQSLVAHALRIANSPFHGLARQIGSMHEAMVVLGLRAVQTLVTTAAITTLFQPLQQRLQEAGYDQHRFWRHSLGAACCARELAHTLHANAEMAYTAGLLHDLGKLVLAVNFPRHFRHIVHHTQDLQTPWLTAERQLLGFDHADISAALAEHWLFPVAITEAIALHHAPEEHTATILPGIVHLADIMAHALNLEKNAAPQVPRLSNVIWHRLGLSWSDFRALLAKVDAQLQDTDLPTSLH